MSTRCQIEFQVRYLHHGKTVIERRTVYRHSDGYPDGVLPELKEFLEWNAGRNSDVEYTTANFIYWSKRKMEETYWSPEKDGERKKWSDKGNTNCGVLHIGFGVCENDEFHGDIAYFYTVVCDMSSKAITVNAYDKGVKLKDRGDVKPRKTVEMLPMKAELE